MIAKQHVTPDKRLILAVCDSELKGKSFSEGEKQLDLSSDFYDGDEMDKEGVLRLMKIAYIVNLVGEEVISVGLEAGVIDKENIMKVDGVPHAEGVVVRED